MTRWFAALLALLLLPLSASANDLKVDNRQWKLVSDRDGIQVYMAHNDDSRIKTFRGVTVVELNDFYSPMAILDDEKYLSRWLYLIKDVREIKRRTPLDRDYQVITGLPWPVADRDAGLHFQLGQDPKTGAFEIHFRAKDGIVPVSDDYVRIPEMTGHFSSVPIGGKKIQVSFEVLLDPGGYIPAFLVNFILKDIPYRSLLKFQRLINTERFAGYYVDYVTVPEPWASEPPIARSPVLPAKRLGLE